METNVCAVCTEEIEDRSQVCILQGCKHEFHSSCVMTFCQYDVRCPVCRQIPAGVAPRENETRQTTEFTLIVENTQQQFEELNREWRRYTARRRRFLVREPSLLRSYNSLMHLRREIATVAERTQTDFEKKCRSIWRTDPAINSNKRRLSNMKRRERRLELIVRTGLEEGIGPEP